MRPVTGSRRPGRGRQGRDPAGRPGTVTGICSAAVGQPRLRLGLRDRWAATPIEARRWWRWIGLITLLALILRVAYILLFRDGFVPDLAFDGQPYRTRLWGDGFVYHKQANLLVDGRGLIAPLPFELRGVVQQAADHPPLYVLYLAFFSKLGLRGDLTHMLVSAPLGAMTALTFGLLGRRVWSPQVGLVAALIGAFNPSLVHFPGFVLSETLTVPLVALLALALYRLWDDPSWSRAGVAGFLCGLTSLSRPDILAVIPLALVPIVLLARRETVRRRLGLLTMAGGTCLLPLLPWFAYNLGRYEKPVLMSVGFDYSLAQGSCDATYYGDLLGYYQLTCMGERLVGTDLELADQSLGAAHLRKVTLDYIGDHLARTPIVVAARIGRVTGLFRPLQQARLEHVTERREQWLTYAAVGSYYPLAVLAVAGGVLLRRRRRPFLPLLAIVASALLGTAITLGVLRYRASAEPALAVLAAVGIDGVVARLGRRWPRCVPADARLPS